MRTATAAVALLLFGTSLVAQRPSDPGPADPRSRARTGLRVRPDAVTPPAGTTMGATAAVAFDAKGHLYVLTRGMQAFFEFDQNGAFVRAFGDGMFTRAHGLRIDREGNLWATDVGAHTVMKLSPGRTGLLTLGTKGQAGEWNEAAGSRKLNQPNDVAIAANGDVFVAQGHTPGPNGDARVLKFDKDGPLHQVSGAARARGPGSSRSHTASPSTPRDCSGSSIARTSASRCSTRTARSSGR